MTNKLFNKEKIGDNEEELKIENETKFEVQNLRQPSGITESNVRFISSEKASVRLREHDYLDRITFYNNFKISNEIYTDPQFPSNFDMIAKEPYSSDYSSIEHSIKFLRINKIYKKAKIFYEKKPDDFQVYPSYFNSKALNIVMNILNQNRKILTKIFYKKKLDSSGVYEVHLFLDNKWTVVQIDDLMPLIDNSIFFTSCSTGEAWVALLEKALAKVAGSYLEMSKINNLENLLRICTGSFSKRYFLDSEKMKKSDIEDVVKFWASMVQVEHIMMAKTNSKEGGKLKQNS